MQKPRIGKLVEWNRDRGYGFLANDSGTVRLFLHIREFESGITPPEVGDLITFFLEADEKGRPQAVRAVNLRRVHHFKPRHFLTLLLLLALPLAALLSITFPIATWWFALLGLAASGTAYSFYSHDKESAESGKWRISELRLHILEAFGGWPGAFLAQRRFRHKCTKSAYQFTFWVIVIGYQIFALDVLRHGEISYQIWSILRSLFAVAVRPEGF